VPRDERESRSRRRPASPIVQRLKPVAGLHERERPPDVEAPGVERRAVPPGRDPDDARREGVVAGQALTPLVEQTREAPPDVAESHERQIDRDGLTGRPGATARHVS
jgi:hypothetical protein